MAIETPGHEFHAPAAFAPALNTPEPLVIVGGQAVNLWGLYYFPSTKNLAPFVSRDLDVLGDPFTAEDCRLHLRPACPVYHL